MADDFEVRELAPDNRLESIYEGVLQPNFGSDELESLKKLRGYLRASPPEAFGLYAAERGGHPIGCCIYYPYPDDEWTVALLGYMAVVQGGRSRGIGTRLFEESQERWFGSEKYDVVLAELDDPRVFPVANGIDPEKRIAFYARLGVRLITAPYFAPCVRPDGERVYGMLLTVLGGSPRALPESRDTVSGDCVATFLRQYFNEEEGSTPGDDAAAHDVAWMLDAYRGHEIPLLPVAEYRSWDPPTPPSRSSR
jgi:GNAT superfamily N-acetyltransferase